MKGLALASALLASCGTMRIVDAPGSSRSFAAIAILCGAPGKVTNYAFVASGCERGLMDAGQRVIGRPDGFHPPAGDGPLPRLYETLGRQAGADAFVVCNGGEFTGEWELGSLKRDRLVKLLDFGVVKASGEKRVVSTQVGVNVGTPGYWSPEAAMAQEQDGRTDVFSLGVILFEMLAGRLPFPFDPNDGPAAVASATSLLTNEAPNVSAVRPPQKDPVPKDLEMTIARALAKKPDARLTMADLFAALSGIYERLSQQAGIVRAPLPTQLSAAPPVVESFDKKPTLAKPRPDLDRVLDKHSSGPTPTVPSAAAPTLVPTLPSPLAAFVSLAGRRPYPWNIGGRWLGRVLRILGHLRPQLGDLGTRFCQLLLQPDSELRVTNRCAGCSPTPYGQNHSGVAKCARAR